MFTDFGTTEQSVVESFDIKRKNIITLLDIIFTNYRGNFIMDMMEGVFFRGKMFMNKVLIDFTNCFGIDKLEYEFDFSVKNVYSIYAKNGSMKTSFANTFQKIQQGKANEICDKIYEIPGNAIVKIDDNDIEKENIFCIN